MGYIIVSNHKPQRRQTMSGHSKQLEKVLQEQLPWHKARIKFITLFIIALIKVCTVNFVKIANALRGSAQSASNYRRIQRFFLDMRSILIMLRESFCTCCLRRVILLSPLTEPIGNLGKAT